ncbi:MAG: hypothetical protein R2873_31120 [Caldilineaceae bacterium]
MSHGAAAPRQSAGCGEGDPHRVVVDVTDDFDGDVTVFAGTE